MEIVSLCVISMYFGAVQFAIMMMIALHPASSYIYNVGVNECFERVSIGKRFNSSDVSRSFMNTTLKLCDIECEREMCYAYAFGIDPRGNGTCEISIEAPKGAPVENPDFDLFVRLFQCRNMTMCFKRLVPGRRLIDRYIRRTFPCDSLARCQLACTIEREFICEGFNYRFATSPEIGSSCQLTAMPGMNLDLTLDFISDRDYDFYSRDRNAPATCGHLTYATWNYGGGGGGGGGYGGGYGGGGAGVGAGGGYDRRPNAGADGWWYKPRDPWLPDGVYGVRVQPRVDPLPPPPDTYTPRWNTGHGNFQA